MGMDFSKVFESLRSNDQQQFTDVDPSSPISGKSFSAGFVYNILSRWYWLVAGPAMYIAYIVLKILKDKGILDAIYDDVKQNLQMLQSVAETCPQYIDNVQLFFNCLSQTVQ